MNKSSWFPMRMFDKSADEHVLFGPCLQSERSNYPYHGEFIKKGETVIWNPNLHKSVSLKAYEQAHATHDEEALKIISSIGIPLNCTFGGCIKIS